MLKWHFRCQYLENSKLTWKAEMHYNREKDGKVLLKFSVLKTWLYRKSSAEDPAVTALAGMPAL